MLVPKYLILKNGNVYASTRDNRLSCWRGKTYNSALEETNLRKCLVNLEVIISHENKIKLMIFIAAENYIGRIHNAVSNVRILEIILK